MDGLASQAKHYKRSFISLLVFPVEAPHILHALPSQAAFDILPRQHNRFAISSQALWIISWLAMTSHTSITLTARLRLTLTC